MAEDNKPTNVVDEGIFHSRAKGVELPASDKGLHAGTYNASLDKAAMQYNNINFYNWAFDAQEQIAIAHNNLVDIVSGDLQLELEDLTEGNSIPFEREEPVYIEWVTGEETEYILKIEGEITLQDGEYINDLKANLYTGDMDGYQGDLILELETDIQYANVQEIANNPDIAKISKKNSNLLRPGIDTQYTINSLGIAEDLLEEIGPGYSFSGEQGYDLYKVTIKPNAKILELPGEIVLQINGKDVTWTADELQNTLIDTNSSEVTQIEKITIGDKTIEIPDDAKRKDVSKLLFGDYDVITYKNQGEDVGSTSYLFKDSNSYTIEKIDDVKFNDDVNKKFYGTNKYDYYSDKAYKFKNQSTSKKYQVKEYNPNFTFKDTPTTVVDDIKLSGFGGNTNVKGSNIAYVDVEEIFPYVEFDRRTNPKTETDIDLIKQTILDEGYMYDTGLNSGVVFPMYIDSQGNIMMGEGNHRIRALYEVAQETGQKIYIPINLDTGFELYDVAEATKITDSSTVRSELNKLFKEFEEIARLQAGETANWIITTGEREGRIINKAVSYLSPGGNGLPQSSVARFLNAIGINAITYDELPDDSIYKTGVNTFKDTPDRPFGPGAAHIDDIAFSTESFIDNLPLEKSVKDLFLNAADTRLKRLAGQVASPGGILDAVDIWEIGVLALVAGAIAYNEIDEIPKIGKNAILRTYNLSQGRPIDAPVRIMGLPTFEISEYDIDFEYAMETLEKGEKVMPTDIIIKELAEHSLEEGKPAVLPGTGVTATTGIDEEFAPYKESIIKEREETAKIKEDEVKQKLLESKGVQEEKMFKKAKPKKSSGAGSGARIL